MNQYSTKIYKTKRHNLVVRKDYINGLILTSQERETRLKPVIEKNNSGSADGDDDWESLC